MPSINASYPQRACASVLMESFGESSLNFTIRFFVSETGNRLPATQPIYTFALKKAYAKINRNSIPQRDIHIRSIAQEFSAINPDIKKTVEPNPPNQKKF